jgi:endonuclease/exonuclease/phosphatase family metal-dependent hydrolase
VIEGEDVCGSRLRLIAWNCHHGSLSSRLAALASFSPAIVFLQECRPVETLAVMNPFVIQRVNDRKGIALASLDSTYSLARLRLRANRGRAVACARVTGPVSFIALGIWSQGPRYVDDVMRTLDAYSSILSSGSTVVMGDLNSGSNLTRQKSINKGHSRIVAALADRGLVSAYHAFHGVDHGEEAHPTYHHQRKASNPWHIDFCFVPAGWVVNVIRVDVLDGKEWAATSDHLPLMVDVRVSST